MSIERQHTLQRACGRQHESPWAYWLTSRTAQLLHATHSRAHTPCNSMLCNAVPCRAVPCRKLMSAISTYQRGYLQLLCQSCLTLGFACSCFSPPLPDCTVLPSAAPPPLPEFSGRPSWPLLAAPAPRAAAPGQAPPQHAPPRAPAERLAVEIH